MNKKGKLYIIITTLTILLIVVLEYTKPQEVNWFPSYASHHKIPFGTFVFHEQLERIFDTDHVVDVNQSPYEYLRRHDSIHGTYMFINNNIGFGDAELETLLNWTSKGNTLFIASEQLSGTLHDTLNVRTSVLSNFENIKNDYQLNLKNKQLKHDSLYRFDKANFIYYYEEIDTLNTSVIGKIDNAINGANRLEEGHANVISQPFGEGKIILSSFPQAFTNYFMLNSPNHDYTAGLLSYINKSDFIFVDNHYKSGKTFYTSPLYIMLKNNALKWAYYLMLIGVFIYVIFEGKRKQRAIPVVNPLRNQTLDFTRTIANMYYEKERHRDMALYKINHFLDYIRTHFHLQTTNKDDAFIEHLAARSNNSIEDTNHIFNTIESIYTKTKINSNELEQLDTLIFNFKSKNTWKTIKT